MMALLVQMGRVPDTIHSRQNWIEKSQIEVDGQVMTFEAFFNASERNYTMGIHSPEAFFDYSKRIYTGMFAKIIRQTVAIDLFEQSANVFCQIARCRYLQIGPFSCGFLTCFWNGSYFVFGFVHYSASGSGMLSPRSKHHHKNLTHSQDPSSLSCFNAKSI